MLDDQFQEKSKMYSMRSEKEIPYTRNALGYQVTNNNPIAIQDQDYGDQGINVSKNNLHA